MSYPVTGTTEERHPLLAAAPADSPGTDAAQDAQALFERMVRRVLTRLLRTPGNELEGSVSG